MGLCPPVIGDYVPVPRAWISSSGVFTDLDSKGLWDDPDAPVKMCLLFSRAAALLKAIRACLMVT